MPALGSVGLFVAGVLGLLVLGVPGLFLDELALGSDGLLLGLLVLEALGLFVAGTPGLFVSGGAGFLIALSAARILGTDFIV